jgi:hypothetical protein
MVFGNVPKLHGLFTVGILAAITAVPIGCGDDQFSGCEASRTCPPKGKGGAAGNGGEAGGGDTGGTSGSGGSAGADEGGAGSGGAGDDQGPTVDSFTPTDGSSDVERDIEVTAELSEPIDESTVTETSVTLEGPDGEVPGTLSVDENVISFVPDRPLYLLGTYTFTIGGTVADLAGNTLAEAASAEFQVRDGRWGAIETPFGRTPRYMDAFARNAAGDVIIAGGQPAEPTIWTALYTANENSWAPEELTLAEQVSLPSNSDGLDIDPQRRVAMSWLGTTSGWYRFTEDEGWDDMGALPNYAVVAVTSEGLATAAWVRDGTLSARTLDLADGALGAVTPLWSSQPPTATDIKLVASLERVALFERTPGTSGQQITVAWRDPISGWGSREPIASAADISGIWAAASAENGSIVVIWMEGMQIWSRIYEREADTWTRPLLITNESTVPSFGSPQMAAGNIGMQLYVSSTAYGAYYQHGVGWIQSSIVDLAELGVGDFTSGFGVQMAMDGRGNLLAIGHTGCRRYIPGEGWQSAVEHGLDLGPWRMWTATQPDGSFVAITHELTANDEIIPAIVRFE